ncbi:MAG: threonine-phosphate decarboxylase CobD [Candidatus Omnitrophota bacterium]
MAGLMFEHGGNVHKAECLLGRRVVDFSANINPLGLPERIKKRIRDDLGSVLNYPDPEARELTRRIARYWGIGEDNVLVGNGSIELIYLIVSAFKPGTALVTAPDFSEYERALRSVKSRMSYLKLIEKDAFKADLTRTGVSDIFFFSNPNNPTGSMVAGRSDGIERLPNKTVVVDEAFMDFSSDEKRLTMIEKSVRHKKVIVLRTFTKFFAMPGLRAGYLTAHKDVVRMLKRHQAPWSVNSLAQRAARYILDDRTYIAETKALIKKERDFLSGELTATEGLKALPSDVNFMLIKIERRGVTSRDLTEGLFRKGILVRDCSNFRGLSGRFIRVAVKKRSENVQLISSLRALLKK